MTRPADLLLVAGGSDWESRVIRFGTRSHWSHICGCVDTPGGPMLAEATQRGIALAPLDKYAHADTHAIDTRLTDDQRAAACAFVLSCVGQTYGFGQIAAITACWLTGKRWFIGREFTEDCASLWARALEHGGVLLPRSPELMRPRDFADLFNVTPRLEAP
jgi:hypothetical protein